MASTKERLAALREYLKTLSAGKTTFIVEGVQEFYTDKDPFTYLLEHGAYTPDGGGSCSIPIQWRGWTLFPCRSMSCSMRR